MQTVDPMNVNNLVDNFWASEKWVSEVESGFKTL